MIGDTAYYNCGDWVESLTALVEHADGRIELLTHRPPQVGVRETVGHAMQVMGA